MYILGNEITVSWVLAPTDSPLLASDYDISFVPSTLDGTYTDDGIINYVAPSEFYSGCLQYKFTPIADGHYRLALTTGAGGYTGDWTIENWATVNWGYFVGVAGDLSPTDIEGVEVLLLIYHATPGLYLQMDGSVQIPSVGAGDIEVTLEGYTNNPVILSWNGTGNQYEQGGPDTPLSDFIVANENNTIGVTINADYEVLNEKDFWVFLSAPISVGSTKVLSALSYPSPKLFHSETAPFGDIDWRNIVGISEHRATGDIYFVGQRQFADTEGTLQIFTPSTGAFTNYTEIPFTDPKGCCVTPSGRVYVLKGGQQASNTYNCYYADAPYTSWTLCTANVSLRFAGNRNLVYDDDNGLIWWAQGTKMMTAVEDTGNFFQQNYDHPTFGDQPTGESNFIDIWDLNGTSWRYFGGPALVGGLGRMYKSQTTSNTAPVPYTDVAPEEDAFDAFAESAPKRSAMTPDGNKVFIIGSQMQLSSTSNGFDFRVDEVDFKTISGHLTTMLEMFTIPAFGKMYIYGSYVEMATAFYEFWESSNGVDWALSTDTRLTDYNISAQIPNTNILTLSNGGFCWVSSTNPGFAVQLVYTK
jgi:hypothetical protein